jgi:hypothetical protein
MPQEPAFRPLVPVYFFNLPASSDKTNNQDPSWYKHTAGLAEECNHVIDKADAAIISTTAKDREDIRQVFTLTKRDLSTPALCYLQEPA